MTDRTRGPEPWFVLTGHTLMVGDLGFERRFNRAFSLRDEESFVRLMLQEIPPRPERAREMRATNLGLPLPADA